MLKPRGSGRQHPLHGLPLERGLSPPCRGEEGSKIFSKKVICIEDTASGQ